MRPLGSVCGALVVTGGDDAVIITRGCRLQLAPGNIVSRDLSGKSPESPNERNEVEDRREDSGHGFSDSERGGLTQRESSGLTRLAPAAPTSN